MCLFTHQDHPVIAERPIECVKIMCRNKKNGDLSNLFGVAYPTIYKLCVLTNMMIRDERDREYFERPEPEFGHRDGIFSGDLYMELEAAIEKGVRSSEDEIKDGYASNPSKTYRYRTLRRGICSFIDEKDAQKICDWAVQTFHFCYEICIVKCEIPVGAKYWKGVSNCSGYECGYVSDQIIPRKILKTQRALYGAKKK